MELTSLNYFWYPAAMNPAQKTQSFGSLIRKYNMFHFILNGSVYYRINGRTYIVKEGECFFTPCSTTTFFTKQIPAPLDLHLDLF
ncbi:AraC family ligand binding domain-containing protein [Sporolactobacillus sp. Y61]|uniref:AraC family ligand binding domain-containing protein n=1 Tax=Sporolactobacillus sp. Y61 TaxID=3160863 RepID=A0AAU8IIX9_9BACL